MRKTYEKKNYLVSKVSTDETEVLYRMQSRALMPRERIPHVRTTYQKWKPDPVVTIKQNYLYARAWESDFGKPIFDNDQDKPRPPNPQKITE